MKSQTQVGLTTALTTNAPACGAPDSTLPSGDNREEVEKCGDLGLWSSSHRLTQGFITLATSDKPGWVTQPLMPISGKDRAVVAEVSTWGHVSLCSEAHIPISQYTETPHPSVTVCWG